MMFATKNGCFSYQGGRDLLNGINFSLGEGETMAILGSNGRGKTTLLKCMMGFLSWDKGASYLDGQDIAEMSEREIWRQVAYIPQAKGMAFSFTGLEMALIGRSAHLGTFQQPGKDDFDVAEAALGKVGVSHLRDKPCGQMSGGELQMVLIARAVAAQPRLMVLDEPETGLDFRNQLVVLELLERLVREDSLALVINTHYPSHAMKIADKTLMLSANGEYFYGPTSSVITKGNMREAFGVETEFASVSNGSRRYAEVIPIALAERSRARGAASGGNQVIPLRRREEAG